MNGTVLAYLGDAVMALWTKEYLVELGYTKSKDLQQLSERYLSANAQSDFMISLLDQDVLTPDELSIYHRGRNTKTDTIPKNSDVFSYRVATGLEALWGHLYVSNQHARLREIWDLFKTHVRSKYDTIPLR